MPFHDGAYYPYSSEPPGLHSSAGIPSLLSSPLRERSPPVMTSAFKFRLCRERVDWRRISAVDIDLVVSQVDVDTLQDYITAVTFCSLEGERCQQCQSPIDPALVKLLRLAQLTVEWLLHCQEFLSMNLHVSEERLVAASKQHEQLVAQLKEQEEKTKAHKEELKQRKKVIRTQQSLLTPRIMNSKKCLHCDKSFLNASFLQNHLQRRHPELQSDTEKKSQIDVLQMEINSLKQQIVQQQQALDTKGAQEKEQQSMHKELLKELEQFKAEEIARMDRKIEDSRDGIRREMAFLHNQNVQALHEVSQNQAAKYEKPVSPVKSQTERDLDVHKEIQLHAIQKLEQQMTKQDEKWESKLQDIKAQHESEKNELVEKLRRMQRSVMEQQEHSEQLQQEMSRRLLEKEQTIQAQREEIKTIFSSLSSKVMEVPVAVSAAAPELNQKRVIFEEPVFPPKLDPVQKLSAEDKGKGGEEASGSTSFIRAEAGHLLPMSTKENIVTDSSNSAKRPAPSKHDTSPAKKQKVNGWTLKMNPDMKRGVRPELELSVIKRLESLGVKSEQNGLKKNELPVLFMKLQSKWKAAAKELPDYRHCRKEIESMVEQKLDSQRKSYGATSEAQTGFKPTFQVMQTPPRSSSLLSRAITSTSGVVQSKPPQPVPRTQSTFHSKISTDSIKSETTPGVKCEYEESDTEEQERKSRKSTKSRLKTAKESQVSGPILVSQAAVSQPFSSRAQSQGSPSTTSQTAVLKVEGEKEEGILSYSKLREMNMRHLQGFKSQNTTTERKNHKDAKINDLARKVEKHRSVKSPAGGAFSLPERNNRVQRLSLTDLEGGSEDRHESSKMVNLCSSEWMGSSMNSTSTSVWGASTKTGEISGATEAGSLCSVSDISDLEDFSSKRL